MLYLKVATGECYMFAVLAIMQNQLLSYSITIKMYDELYTFGEAIIVVICMLEPQGGYIETDISLNCSDERITIAEFRKSQQYSFFYLITIF